MNPLILCAILSLGSTPTPRPAFPPAPAPTQAEVEAVRAVVKANSAFAIDLHQRLCNQKGNLVYSPWSISTVLALTSVGAQGETLAQMNKTLRLPEPRQTHVGVSQLLRLMQWQRGYEMNAVNAMFTGNNIPWRKDFLDYTRYYYGASIYTPNFRDQPEASRQLINGWVEAQTRNRIRGLLPPGAIRPDTGIVLVNAIYFKGAWESPFKQHMTQVMNFSLTAKDKVAGLTMFQSGGFLYGENETVQVLGMPYQGQDLMMMLILPRERNELAKLEKDLTGDHMQDWIARLELHPTVDVFLPRFRLAFELNMKETLADMGMRDLFNDNANLSGMATNHPLKVTGVLHKAFLELQEEGTEAAAATAIPAGVPLSPNPRFFTPPPPRPVFRADHPFLFSIVDRRSGSLLFMGRMSDPTK